MMDRKPWTAADRAEIRRMFPFVTPTSEDDVMVAAHFGCEIREGIPEGEGYWALEPLCVLGHWYRHPGETRWECLRCATMWAFTSRIVEEFVKKLREE